MYAVYTHIVNPIAWAFTILYFASMSIELLYNINPKIKGALINFEKSKAIPSIIALLSLFFMVNLAYAMHRFFTALKKIIYNPDGVFGKVREIFKLMGCFVGGSIALIVIGFTISASRGVNTDVRLFILMFIIVHSSYLIVELVGRLVNSFLSENGPILSRFRHHLTSNKRVYIIIYYTNNIILLMLNLYIISYPENLIPLAIADRKLWYMPNLLSGAVFNL
ncbi:hypothetical protein NEIG_00831 [Nematocida sp. ERTm5]|nr:hypothetical protein NEIG_00831 [Nematocida sp. ERTm5]